MTHSIDQYGIQMQPCQALAGHFIRTLNAGAAMKLGSTQDPAEQMGIALHAGLYRDAENPAFLSPAEALEKMASQIAMEVMTEILALSGLEDEEKAGKDATPSTSP